MKTIIYAGRACFPERDATANRILAIAQILRKLGYHVVLIGWNLNVECMQKRVIVVCGFDCFELHRPTNFLEDAKFLLDNKQIEKIIGIYADACCVILYNYPAFALHKLMKHCKQKSIKCVCDVTEWYSSGTRSPFVRLTRYIENGYRMRYLHKKVDGLIVISNFLKKYYEKYVSLIVIPPLVDTEKPEWNVECKNKQDDKLKLVFAGSIGKHKEKINIVVEAIEVLEKQGFHVILDIVGVTEQEFRRQYGIGEGHVFPASIVFHGKCTHSNTLQLIREADYSVIIRPDSRTTQAGFSTKFSESISLGIPVIVNDIGDVKQYISKGENGIIVEETELVRCFEEILRVKPILVPDKSIFDYRRYVDSMHDFLCSLFNEMTYQNNSKLFGIFPKHRKCKRLC